MVNLETDQVFLDFLSQQYQCGMALNRESDLIDLEPLGEESSLPPQRYRLKLHCRGLVREARSTEVSIANDFEAAIWFYPNYLREVRPFLSLSLVSPTPVWHPNVCWPLVCLGDIAPGTELVDLIYQFYEIISYQKLTTQENNCLNRAACAWARHNMERIPVDNRPLKRSSTVFKVEALPQEARP
ncbi:MAG: hypothetical protein V3T77_02665 [Planctomycetota bacterium]